MLKEILTISIIFSLTADMYIEDIRSGFAEKAGEHPKILKETVATAWVDGNNGSGRWWVNSN